MNLSLFHNEGLEFKDDFEQNIAQIFLAIAISESPPCLTYRLLVTPSASEARKYTPAIRYNFRIRTTQFSQIDAQIAAITRSNNATLATRNVVDFEFCQINIINPFSLTQQ